MIKRLPCEGVFLCRSLAGHWLVDNIGHHTLSTGSQWWCFVFGLMLLNVAYLRLWNAAWAKGVIGEKGSSGQALVR